MLCALSASWGHLPQIPPRSEEPILEVSPLRHLRTHCPPLRTGITFFLALKVSFLHCCSHALSQQMLRLLVPYLWASSDQLCTYQSRSPSACVPSELSPTWPLLSCELLGRFRKSLNQLLPQDLSLPWFVFLHKLIGLILHTYFFSH